MLPAIISVALGGRAAVALAVADLMTAYYELTAGMHIDGAMSQLVCTQHYSHFYTESD